MAAQNYSNHSRYYIPHHFFFYGSILLLTAFAIYMGFTAREHHFLWMGLAALTLLVGWLSFMLRQHYGKTLQDRLVIFELRYRYFALTGERLEPLEEQLSQGQLFALRFAPDEELPALIRRAIDEKLSSDGIKRAVKNWKADYRRI
jgi:hypothetical protein